MAAGTDARYQRIGRHPVDRFFPSRIDRRHHHRIGIVEADGKFVEQVMQPGEAMRLGNSNDAALGGIARRLQHGGDLDRMVTVIVEYFDPVP